MRARYVASGLAALAVALGGCSDAAPDAPSFAVSDSAGVEVVATQTPSWPDGGQSPWSIELLTEIGALDGAEPYLFGGPVRATLLPDGRIAAADEQSGDIRVYAADGQFVERWGSRGEGPGEFQGFSWLDVCGDQLVAYDWIQRRVTGLSFEGEVEFTTPAETPEGQPPYRSRCVPDGSLLAVGWGDMTRRFEPGIHLFSQPAEVWRLFPQQADSSIDLGTYLSSERLARIRESGVGGSGPHPFGRAVVLAGSNDEIVIGSAERLQLEVRTLDGVLTRIMRGPDGDLVMDEAFIDSYRAAELTGEDSVSRATLVEGDFPLPPRYPAYSEVLIDDQGFVWAERFSLPWSTERRWGVFDPDGVFLGHLEFPSDFEMTGIQGDRVIGIAADEFGVLRVRVYRVNR